MATLTYLPLQESELTSNASSLISTFLSTASWIWTAEDSTLYPPPQAPGSSQRAFRRTFTDPSPPSRVASSTTIIITADNYFELFINGILLHAANPNHAWETPLLFKVPLPALSQNVTYAIRAVNKFSEFGAPIPSFAGLRVAIQVDFSSPPNSPPDVFYTSGGGTWRSSHIFGIGWEQPKFDESDWEGAKEMPPATNGTAVWNTMNQPTRFYVATSIPQSFGAPEPAPTPTDTIDQGAGEASQSIITFAPGQLAGMIIGIIACAGIVGALIAFLFIQRRLRSRQY